MPELNLPTFTPAVGALVHYQAYGSPGGEYPSVTRAAIVTEVRDYGAKFAIAVLNPTGMFFLQDAPYSPDPKPGHWSYATAGQAQED